MQQNRRTSLIRVRIAEPKLRRNSFWLEHNELTIIRMCLVACIIYDTYASTEDVNQTKTRPRTSTNISLICYRACACECVVCMCVCVWFSVCVRVSGRKSLRVVVFACCSSAKLLRCWLFIVSGDICLCGRVSACLVLV